ncbi:alpha/beta fold hydrolase [Carboxylicivirga marina]|uniref:Alpha/beta fold hydrolase n=1 Tax=Carboxylicivirga marina TaxID=2800988 RepID=A0ABS1HQP1_9BACT|nr:alpha/beta fold hydrolase [Carboxylicivirga marina]MBK3519999.1 alpha/beta fold hydrolase [Carboxylicivirga marina]
MKTNKITLIALVSLILCYCSPKEQVPFMAETQCPIEVPKELIDNAKFKYGYIKVPEFHKQPNAKQLELAVAVFKCLGDSATQPPFVLNTGGPGLSNIDNFLPMFSGEGQLFLDKRDIVIIELRGLKYSKPYLETPEIINLQNYLIDKHLTADETLALYRDSLQLAYNRFTNEGINLSAFNYKETVSDIVYIMEGLGYNQFSLFGSSAGTIIAQQLMMDYPEKISSVMLNAVVDMKHALNNAYFTTIEMLESIFNECETNEKYAKAYPDLKKRFLARLDYLNVHPDTIVAKRPGTDKDYQVVINGNKVSRWLFLDMYWNTQTPLSMHRIIEGDYSELVQRPGAFFPMDDFSNGLSFSSILAGWPKAEPWQIPDDGEYHTFIHGLKTMMFGPLFFNELRKFWHVEDASAQVNTIATYIPTLMLSGKSDHVCPYGYAQNLAEQFELAHCFVYDGIAHSPVDYGSCGIMLIKQFVDNPTGQLDATCVDEFKGGFMLP